MNDVSLKKLRIFAASPSDVASERAKLETVVKSLKPMADYLGLALEFVDWRDVVPGAGRPQQVIFDQLKPTSWDIFVGILWHRFGTPSGAQNPQTQKDYLSGTEEEFRVAYRLWKQFGKPRIVMYRCTRLIPLDADLVQAQHVKDFIKEIQDPSSEFRVLIYSFDTVESFEKLTLDNLQKLLIEYGEQSKTPITPEVVQTLAPKIPNNLPRRAAFFGRAKEMDVAMRALSPADRTWGVLVDGIGGIGKSALSIEAAHRAQDAGAFDAFVFITAKQNILAPSGIREQTPAARTLDDFLNETARILGQLCITKLTSDEKRRVLLDMLRAMRTLLIYDNLETLSKEEQETMVDFLRELPQGCKAIITSRRRGGEGAVWLRLEALDWDAARGIIENEMARDLGLANKLRRVESRWQELYDETHGSPLALVHTLGLMRVRAALTFDNALAMLRGNLDTVLQKFIFQEALRELTTNDKTALCALSFFVPSATFEALMQVANLSRNALETTIDRLSALSLVDVLLGEERYALHPLTRAFVRSELLADTNIALKMGMRFARYWVDYANTYQGTSRYESFSRIEEEWPNLETAANWLWMESKEKGNTISDQEAALLLMNIVRPLRFFLWSSGRWDERVQLNARAYHAACSLGEWKGAGWHAYRVAITQIYRNCIEDAMLWTKRCAEAWSQSGNRSEQTTIARLGGLVAQRFKEYDRAEQVFKSELTNAINQSDVKQTVNLLTDLGKLAYERRKFDEAEHYFTKALKLSRKKRQVPLIVYLGLLKVEKEQWIKARKWFEKALGLLERIRPPMLIAKAQSLSGLARVHEAERHVDLALPLAQEAFKIYERLQHKDLAEVRELMERLKKAER